MRLSVWVKLDCTEVRTIRPVIQCSIHIFKRLAVLNQSEQYSSGSSFQNHARQFREDYQPPKSDRPSRYQSEQYIRNNSYTYDCTRPNHGTSAGLRAPYVRPSWQNRIQNQGNIEWGPAAQSRQSRSEFAPERQ